MSLTAALSRFANVFKRRTTIPVNAKDKILAMKDGVFAPRSIVNQVGFIETDEQLAVMKAQKESFATVFNQWQRFARKGDEDPNDPYADDAYPSELTSWSYDSANDRIRSTVNSTSFIGFISNQRYSNYTLETVLRSGNSDDDYIGLVIAHAVDDQGNAHTLDVMRALMGTAPMSIIKDRRVDSNVIRNVYSGLKWPDGSVATGSFPGNQNRDAWGWNNWGNGIRLKITREDDLITVETSQINQTTYFDPAKTVIDLTADPALAVFRGPQRYGYCCQSQASSTWEVLQRAGERMMILDTRTMTRYDSVNNTWVASQTSMAELLASGELTANWLHHNPTTGSFYYVDLNAGILKL
jgi:hypothetical protein